MKTDSKLAIIPFEEIVRLINPLQDKLVQIEVKLDKNKSKSPQKYYRNKELKLHFGLSNNTIIKYRIGGVIPFTKLGDVFLYPIAEINKILIENSYN
jgi:hypothetical protein